VYRSKDKINHAKNEKQTPQDCIVRGGRSAERDESSGPNSGPSLVPIGRLADLDLCALFRSTFAVVSFEACSRQPSSKAHGFRRLCPLTNVQRQEEPRVHTVSIAFERHTVQLVKLSC